MVQGCLNRTEAHLWAIVTNGRRLRLLRDSSSFSTAAYVDFGLEALFDGELFSEFVLLYSLLHASRVAVAEGAAASGAGWRSDAPRPSPPAPVPWTSSVRAYSTP
ncbi:hypothetical protein [Streptomyces sp. NPDC014734]|uniref:hypothetical protein n=1 Tax=Streptomyces sp. NPDC014734 TaxID=3364886 RepID=UPI0036FCE502